MFKTKMSMKGKKPVPLFLGMVIVFLIFPLGAQANGILDVEHGTSSTNSFGFSFFHLAF